MSANITNKEINKTIAYLRQAAKRGNRVLFDSNAGYLRSMIEMVIQSNARELDLVVMPLYSVKIYSQITETEAVFDVRATSETAAIRALVNRGFHSDRHVVRSVDLVKVAS